MAASCWPGPTPADPWQPGIKLLISRGVLQVGEEFASTCLLDAVFAQAVMVPLDPAKLQALRANEAGLTFTTATRLFTEIGGDLDVKPIGSDDLKLIGKAAYQAHRLALARDALGEVIVRDDADAGTYLDLGLVELRDGNMEAALSAFEASKGLDPSLAPARIESAAVKRRLKRWDGVLIDCLAFADRNAEPIGKAHARVLKEVANSAFDSGDRTSAGRIFRNLSRFSNETGDVALRLAESVLALGDAVEAHRILLPLYRDGRLDGWGLSSFASACMQLGMFDEAKAAFEHLYRSGHHALHFDAQHLRLHYLQGDFAGAKSFLDSIAPRLDPQAMERLLFEYHIKAGLTTAAFDQIASGAIELASYDRYLLMEAAYKLISINEHDKALTLVEALTSRYSTDANVIALRMSYHFSRQEWEQAAEIAASVPDDVLEDSRELKLRCLELYAFLREFDRALQYRHRLGPVDQLPRSFIPPIIRLHAETKDWDAVIALLPLVLNIGFDYDIAAGEIIVRACRRSGTYGPVVQLIESQDGWTGGKGLKKLRAILLEDAASNEDDILSLLADPHVVEFTWAKQRLLQKSVALRSKTPASGTAVHEKHAIFFCTNASYLCATAVSLYSLLRSNQSALDYFDIFTVLDDDIFEQGSKIISNIGAAFGIKPEVLKASDIVGSLEGLSGEYGIFTGGHSLAPAAFYRIFFAKYANEVLKRRRGLYIDSDTIIAGPILSLLEAPSMSPLAARREVDRPEVLRAITAHNLSSGEYFNSGVLLFDFTSEAFARLIDRTIATIHDTNVTLLFHDQCALNIGFDGVIEALDPRYNCFVAIGADPVQLEVDNVVLHFLDRPKPWDASYDGPASAYWFKHWRELASIVGGGVALDLLGSAQ